MRWSPHAIAAELCQEGSPAGLRVCAETIYRACYDHTGGSGLPEGCWRKLPRRCRRRKPRSRAAATPGPLGHVRGISERPAAAAERSEPGHWEGDLIIGERNRSAVVTLIERASRFTLLAALPGGYNSDAAAAAVTAAMRRVPSHMAKTLTWDRGSEMARWKRIEADTGIQVFFCDPRSPWQRPSNEQNNALIRRWLPKGTDLNVGPIPLAIIEDNLNTMPRELHRWETAHTVYTALTCNHH